MYLPSLEERKFDNNDAKARRRHSYTGEDDAVFPPPMLPPTPTAKALPVLYPPQQSANQQPKFNEVDDFDEKKARYKLQLRQFRHRRRYSDWFFTLYEFDKPENPEESLALDNHLFETIISRLHGIYALSLNSVFDPNSNQKPARLCFERLPELPVVPPRRQPNRQRRRRCVTRYMEMPTSSSTSSCVSCISFSMFDCTSPHNPGQLFCPETEVGCGGALRSLYCQGCGRNMTGGSSLVSVAGSSETCRQPDMCYSMMRSVEFYQFTRTIQLQKSNQSKLTESRHRASPSQHHFPPQTARERVCRTPKRSRRRSLAHRYGREATSVPPIQPPPVAAPTMHSQQLRSSTREKRKKVKRVMHKRMSQQRVADWLVATHGGQAAACSPPLIVF